MGNLGKHLRAREPVPAVTESGGVIDWRNLTPAARQARVEGWSASRTLHAADWLNARVLADDFDGPAAALDADGKLRHYARQQPSAILPARLVRAQTPNYDSGRGSPVVCPFTFAGEAVPESWGAS
jgi:hypothetical protein